MTLRNLLAGYGTLEEARKRIAWANTTAIPGSHDRRDCDNRIIRWSEYGKLTAFGWEIDHIQPTILGGPDIAGNLRARHWQGNRSAGGMLSGLFGSGIGGDRR